MPQRMRGIFQKEHDGAWWIRWFENKKERVKKCGPDIKLAERMLRDKHRELEEGKRAPVELTVAQAIGHCLTMSADLVSLPSVKRYARLWTELIGNRALDSIRPQEIAVLKEKWGRTLAAATVNHRLKFLRRTYNIARKNGYIAYNPVDAITLLYEDNERTRHLSQEEEATLRAVFFAPRKPKSWACWWPYVEFAYLTGMRQGEQFGLRWPDIDEKNCIATIVKKRKRRRQTKHVPLSSQAMAILQALPSRGTSEWVFASTTGKKMNTHNWIKRVFDNAIKKAGIEDFSWHDLRHTYFSMMVEDNDLYTVQRAGGHSSIRVTERYAHLAKSKLHAAVEKIVKKPQL